MAKSAMGKAINKQIKKQTKKEKVTKRRGLIEGVDSDYQWVRKDTGWKTNTEGWT